MTSWLESLSRVEALEDIHLDEAQVAEMERRFSTLSRRQVSGINFYTPSFKSYVSSEIQDCGKNAWPALSITGNDCKLQCDHCKARVLQSMLSTKTPEDLWRVANERIAAGAQGMLLSGGSNHRDEVEYGPFYPTLRRIKDVHPAFKIAIHTALVDRATARRLEDSGADVAMLDIIGAQETIREVYHLKRSVADFETSLQFLTETSLKVVPHIVIGLHYGRFLGERAALEIVGRHKPAALVLVVAMPFYASPRRPFVVPDSLEVGRFFIEARAALPDIPLLLGCARPPGRAKQQIDAYAVMAGVNGIAHPAEGMVELAARLGREVRVTPACCSIAAGSEVLAGEGSAVSTSAVSSDIRRIIARERSSRTLGGIKVVTRHE